MSFLHLGRLGLFGDNRFRLGPGISATITLSGVGFGLVFVLVPMLVAFPPLIFVRVIATLTPVERRRGSRTGASWLLLGCLNLFFSFKNGLICEVPLRVYG